MLGPWPVYLTNIFEQLLGTPHCRTTNEMTPVFRELTNSEDRCILGELTPSEDAGACWTLASHCEALPPPPPTLTTLGKDDLGCECIFSSHRKARLI